MVYLIITSLIWAFSFGIVKTTLAGVDPTVLAFERLLLAFLVFVPFLRIEKKGTPKGDATEPDENRLSRRQIVKLLSLGAVQYGLMYLFYLRSFQYLKAYQVAFFTIFTPLFVTLLNDLLDRKFRPLFFITAGMAVIGTAVIVYKEIGWADLTTGFAWVQASNVCFAIGQVLYRRGRLPKAMRDKDVFGLLYLGALLVTIIPAGIASGWSPPALTMAQVDAILYLGLIASGLCFFLWNVGAKKVNAGALAILNNLKIPLAAFVSILVFRESADLWRVSIGSLIIVGALFINERMGRETTPLPGA